MAETKRHPIWQLVYAIEMDIRAASAKMQEFRAHIASMELPEPTDIACPVCGIQTRGPNTLSEHLYTSHDGALPPHWEQADRLAD